MSTPGQNVWFGHSVQGCHDQVPEFAIEDVTKDSMNGISEIYVLVSDELQMFAELDQISIERG